MALWLCAGLRLALLFLRGCGHLLSDADGLSLTLLRGKRCHHLTHEHGGGHHDGTTCHRTSHQLGKELRGCWESRGKKVLGGVLNIKFVDTEIFDMHLQILVLICLQETDFRYF